VIISANRGCRVLTAPYFELVDITSPSEVTSRVPEELRVLRVPKALIGRSYTANQNAQVVEQNSATLICFGTSGLSERICISIDNGRIVQLGHSATPEQRFVNSSLTQFANCVGYVIDRFPFYASGSEVQVREAVSAELATLIRGVDATALEPDSFWSTFIEDVEIGDYSTEDVVSRFE